MHPFSDSQVSFQEHMHRVCCPAGSGSIRSNAQGVYPEPGFDAHESQAAFEDTTALFNRELQPGLNRISGLRA